MLNSLFCEKLFFLFCQNIAKRSSRSFFRQLLVHSGAKDFSNEPLTLALKLLTRAEFIFSVSLDL